MLRKAAILLILPLFILPSRMVTGQVVSAPDIAAAAAKAVVSIKTIDSRGTELGSGTGWVVEASGTIVTNYHVIAGANSLIVTLPSGEVFDRVYVVAMDRERDLALLRISAGKLAVLALGNDDVVRVGDRIYAMGNPLGLDRTFSDGLVSSKRVLRGTQQLQITAPISPGSSGGPVMNAAGEVIGVAASQMSEGQNLNLAIPSRYVRFLLDGPRRNVLYSRAVAPDDAPRPAVSGASADAAPAKVGADRWETSARDELVVWMAKTSKDYVQSHEVVTGALKEGGSEETEFILRRGKFYAVLGTCDQDCTDIDLAILDRHHSSIDNDVSASNHPVAVVQVAKTGSFYVKVVMAKCAVDPCRYAFTILSKR